MSKHTIKFYKLKELCNDIIDCPHSTPIWRNQGIPIIRNYNLSNDILTPHNLSYVDEKTYLERIKRAKPEVNDIIISREAPMGAVGLVPHNFICCLGQRTVLLKVNKNKCLPQYLFYALMSKFVQKQIQIINQTGSIVSNLNITDLKNLIVPIVDNQNKIALLLTNILEKIRSNNKINAELEAMTKTIYDYWFLQFEFPNEEGKPYKSSGGKMVWNEELKREIPEGWEVNKLEEYISVIRGVNYKRDDVLSNKETNYIPLIKSNNIQNGQILFDDIIFVPQKLVNKNQILSKNSVLMTMSSGSKEHMGKTTIIYDSLDYTFGAFCSKIEIIEDMRCFLSIFFRSALFKTLIDNITSGTNINNISNEHLYNIKMTIPNKKVLQKFEDILNPILDKQGIIQKENQELTSLRDFLLPLLMNGQVGFKEDKAEG